MTSVVERTESSYLFKDNSTFLDQENWMEFFGNQISNGFFGYPLLYSAQQDSLYFNQTTKAYLQGLYFSTYQTWSIAYGGSSLYGEHQDVLMCYAYKSSSNKLSLLSIYDIANSDDYEFLAHILSYLSHNSRSISLTLKELTNNAYDYFLPIFYGKADGTFYDLSRIIHKNGETYFEGITQGSGTNNATIAEPKYGDLIAYGSVKIYGGQKYNVTIESSYPEYEYYLYPVPCCNMESTSVYIKNETENTISIKIPKMYDHMYFDYVHTGEWVDYTEYISYSLLADAEVIIDIAQTYQDTEYVLVDGNGGYYPKSLYKVTQNNRDFDSGEGYTKAEANAIFETKANVETALAGKVDTADLGDLATKDNVDYETDITNLPDFGTLATEDDVDSDDKAYGRKNGEWYDLDGKYVTQSDLDEKTDTNVIADEYDSSETYTVGDVVMHEGVLYKDTEDWTVLDTTKITASGSIGAGKYLYYTNPYGLYVSTQAFSWAQSNASDAIQWMLNNNKVTQVSYIGMQYDRFKTDYTAGQIILVDWDTFVSLNSTTSKFSPVTVKELISEKVAADSPAFTGTPTAPTPTAGDSSTKIATTAFVDNAIDTVGVDKLDTTNVAPDYDSTATYNAGDLVIMEGQLKQYRYNLTEIHASPIPTTGGDEYPGTYLYYGTNLFLVKYRVNFAVYETQEEAYDFVLSNPEVFQKIDSEILTYEKEYETDSVVYSNGKFWRTESTLSFISLSVEDLLDEKLSVSTFLNAFGHTNTDISSIDNALEGIQTELALKAPLASPAFTGTPTAPTLGASDDSTKIATTAFVHDVVDNVDMSAFAPLASPAFTGTPTAPTQVSGDNSKRLATTAFVHYVVDHIDMSAFAPLASPAFTGTPTAPTLGASDDSTKIATTAFVHDVLENDLSSYALLASPALTGTPTAPTAALPNTNTTQIATTAFVQNAIESALTAPGGEITSYYVDWETGSDDNEGTTAETAFATVEKAIDTALIGSYTNIYITPGSYAAPNKISRKKINFIATGDTSVVFVNYNQSSNASLLVTESSYVSLIGTFEIYGPAIRIDQNSTVIHKNRTWNSNSTLTCTIFGERNIIKNCISVYGNSKFFASNDLYINFSNDNHEETQAAIGLVVADGSIAQVEDIILNGFLYTSVVANAGILLYQSITQSTSPARLYEATNGGIVLNTSEGYYSQSQINTLLSNKADNADVILKAPIASPTFTGVPKAPTASASTNNTQIATTAFVNNVLIANGLKGSATLYVDGSNGNDSTGTGAQSAPFKTIQKAVDSANPVIPVQILAVPGVYGESITINGKNITLQGITNTEIRIIGQGIYPAIEVTNGGKLRLLGIMTLSSNNIGALEINYGSDATYIKLASTDKLTLSPGSTSGECKALWVDNCSQFSADGEVFVNVNGDSSKALYVRRGGQAFVTTLNVSMRTGTGGGTAVDTTRGLVMLGSLTGTYQTNLSQTNSIVKIGNSIV